MKNPQMATPGFGEMRPQPEQIDKPVGPAKR
jgi:hypothetical protein